MPKFTHCENMSRELEVQNKLRRDLTLFDIVSIGIGTMIGGTIFSTIGLLLTFSNVGELLILSLIINSIVAFSIGYNYAKLSNLYPSSGAGYSFVSKIFPKNIFIRLYVGYTSLFAYASACTFYATVFTHYIARLLNLANINFLIFKLISIFVIVGVVLINIWGVKKVGIFEDFFTWFKIIVLIMVIISGFTVFNSNVICDPRIDQSAIIGILQGATATFLGFEGFETIVYAVEESKDRRSIEKGIYISLIIVPIIYLLVALVTFSALRTGLINIDGKIWGQETILCEIACIGLGKFGYLLVSLCAISATLSAINGTIYAVSRLVYAMSRDNIIPYWLSKLNRNGTPYRSIIFMGLISISLLFFENALEKLGELTSLSFLICFSIVSIASLKVRKLTKANILLILLGIIAPIVMFAYAVLYSPHVILTLAVWSILLLLLGYTAMNLSKLTSSS